MLDDLKSNLGPNEDVAGLLLFGSFGKPVSLRDEWSDIDIFIVLMLLRSVTPVPRN